MIDGESDTLVAALLSSLDPAGSGPSHPVVKDILVTPGDPRLRLWLGRCLELARSDLDGIEDPANALATLA